MTTFVLGGGVAGLVAAFGLLDRGHRVVLLESRAWLGGRAFSSPDRRFGRDLDNGPHAMLGCYRAMRSLLRRIGTDGDFQQDARLQMAYRRAGGGVDRLSLSRLPAPLAMPAALWRLRLDRRTKLVALRGMVKSLLGAPASWTVADWLDRNGQRGEPDALLWRPLCRAIMNVEPELASARSFLGTLREAFSGSAAMAAFWLPKKPWCEVLGEPARRALLAAGAEVRCGERVIALQRQDCRIIRISTPVGDHDVAAGDLVVGALPWFALTRLIGEESRVAALASSPIVSAYFELNDGAPLLTDDGPVVALVDGDPFHFLLRTPGGSPRHFALLSGGSRAFDGQTVAAIEQLAREQLARFYPGVQVAATVRIRKEQHATFVNSPQDESARPAPGASVPGFDNLRVCGDWTATGLPATLEGAARSAEMLLREVDRVR